MSEKKIFAVIGDPIAHSLSPVMHNAAFRVRGKNAEYTAIQVKAEYFTGFLTEARSRLAGFNVTVPHKQLAWQNMDRRSPGAELSGSVNTVRIDENGSILYGDTTDGYGFERAVLEKFQFPLKNADICFIGCGGVSHALVWHAALAGARSIRILNRTIEKAQLLLAAVRAHFPSIISDCAELQDKEKTAEFLTQSGLAVQCTSLGLKDEQPMPIDPDLFPRSNIRYFDTIYRCTPLLKAVEAKGIPVQNGASMLLYQGAKSYEIWFGEPAPIEIMWEALCSCLK